MGVSLGLKYAGRHALKRNPWVVRWAAEMRSREFSEPAAHRARQEDLLRRILHGARRIPAYSRAAAQPHAVDLLAHLRDAFPIIDKSSLLHRGAEFWPQARRPRLLATVATTSGTTGTPLDVFRSFASILREEAFHLQHWHWAGWQRGQRQAVLRGDIVIPIERREAPYWLEDSVGRQLVLSTRHLDRKTATGFAQELLSFGAMQLRAYPSAAYELATLVEQTGIPLRFNAVITGSEMLYDFQRARIERVFNAKVFDFYSMAERVAYASQCEHGRMHVNPEYGVLEIVDEHGRPTEGEGNIVGTALHNSLIPLIRYRMNDTARWNPEPCPCGRTYPVIDKIGGRLADQLYDLDGRAVNCTVIGFAFDGMHNIQRAQVAQTAADRWVIRIVPETGYTDLDGNRVLMKLAAEVSARVAVTIEVVSQIPTLPNGKFKWVSQEFLRGSQPAATSAGSRVRHSDAGLLSSSAALSQPMTTTISATPAAGRSEWEAIFAQLPFPHFTQAWSYGEGKRAAGWSVERLVFSDDTGPVALCQVLVKRVLGMSVAARINRGPLFLQGSPSEEQQLRVFAALRARWRFARRGLLLIAPALPLAEESSSLLRAAGFLRRRAAGWGSSVIDLQPSHELMRAAVSSKWRNHLKASLKAGIELRVRNDAEIFGWMLEQHASNMAAKQFEGPAVGFVDAMIQSSPQDFRVFQACIDNEPCCGILVARFGNRAETFLSWTGDVGRRSHAHHFLLWQVLVEMKAAGCRALDLGGYTTNQKYGAYKKEMKGSEYRLVGEWLAL